MIIKKRGFIMNCCANCGLCYPDPHSDGYRCMRGKRGPIKDLFILGRTACEKHVHVDALIIKESK